MFWLALYTTLTVQSVMNILEGYNIDRLSYLILPIYGNDKLIKL